MGGIYSSGEMERQIREKNTGAKDRNDFDRIRIPFRLLCDIATQTEDFATFVDGMFLQDGSACEESQVNFSSIYLQCHSPPAKALCDNCAQTEYITVSRSVQTDDVIIIELLSMVDSSNQTETAGTVYDEHYDETASSAHRYSISSQLQDMPLLSLKYESDCDDGSDVETYLDAIEGKYLSPNSEDEFIEKRRKYKGNQQLKTMDSRRESYLNRVKSRENKIKDEFDMRQLIDVDAVDSLKFECLQRENKNMKYVVEQYEDVIKDLTEQTRDMLLTDSTLTETINEKEMLQQDLDKAECSLMDAYKRIERLKMAIDKYKQNEESTKLSLYDFQTKLYKSEEKYKRLRQQATEKVEAANTEIARVQKEKDVELAGIQAALQKCRIRNMNLEKEIEQKSLANRELSQICDELIKNVASE